MSDKALEAIVAHAKAYTCWWSRDTVAAARKARLDGAPLTSLSSDGTVRSRLSRTGAKPGDTVVLLTQVERKLYLLGAMRVVEVIEDGRALRGRRGPERLPTAWLTPGPELVLGDSLAPLRFDQPLPAELERRWSWSVTGRKFGPIGGDPTGLHVLAPRTATLALRHLQAPLPERAARTRDVALLERAAQRRGAALSEARVLCDAWHEAGDPRAELLALELAIAEAPSPERAEALDQRLAEVAAQAPHVTEQPGGYPWRAVWKERPVEQLEQRVRFGARSDGLLARSVFERIEMMLGRPGLWLSMPRALSGPVLRDARLALERFAFEYTLERGDSIDFLVERNVDVERFAAALPRVLAVTRELRLRTSGLLVWPGTRHKLPLGDPATGHLRRSRLVFDFGRGQLVAQLTVPLPLPDVKGLLRHYRDAVRFSSRRATGR